MSRYNYPRRTRADAGIGAAGGFALSMIGLGGALVISGQRTRHTHPPKAMIG